MSEEGFLSRWSRRKRAIESGEALAEPATAEPVPIAESRPPVPDDPPFDITTLPPVETLTIDSDFTAFLRKEVPEMLKRAALRKAWALDPAIRDFVGPAEYAWDYNAPDGVPGSSLNLIGNTKEMLARILGAPEEDEPGAPPAATAETIPEPPARIEQDAPPPALADSDDARRIAEAAESPAPSSRRHGTATPS